MGTYASVSVPRSERDRLDEYRRACQSILKDLENRLSIYDPESEISRLNAAAGGPAVAVSPPTRRVLEMSRDCAEKSEGRFDVTVAPLVELWGFHGGELTSPPDGRAISNALELVGYRGLRLSDNGARLELAGMRVDLGGIAKGFAVDRCFEELRRMGARNVMVNLGGNLRCGGCARPGKPWRIGVRDPFDRTRIAGRLHLTGGMAVATSGDYERFVELDGERYAHIIDPCTGRPVRGTAAVTVVSTNAARADAMSTALFVAGTDAAQSVLARVPGCHALIIPRGRPVRMLASPGFSDFFTPAPGASVLPLPDVPPVSPDGGTPEQIPRH